MGRGTYNAMTMRSPVDVLMGRVSGLHKSEIARRTVPCFKHVLEPEGERLALCLLVDSGYLYRYPFETTRGIKSLEIKARYLKGEMEHLLLREFQPGLCRYVSPPSEAVSA
jgi:hypothetical protein